MQPRHQYRYRYRCRAVVSSLAFRLLGWLGLPNCVGCNLPLTLSALPGPKRLCAEAEWVDVSWFSVLWVKAPHWRAGRFTRWVYRVLTRTDGVTTLSLIGQCGQCQLADCGVRLRPLRTTLVRFKLCVCRHHSVGWDCSGLLGVAGCRRYVINPQGSSRSLAAPLL